MLIKEKDGQKNYVEDKPNDAVAPKEVCITHELFQITNFCVLIKEEHGQRNYVEDKPNDTAAPKEVCITFDLFQITNICVLIKEELNSEGTLKGRTKDDAKKLLPGQPSKEEIPASTLTSPTFTDVTKRKISSQKYPCYMPKVSFIHFLKHLFITWLREKN